MMHTRMSTARPLACLLSGIISLGVASSAGVSHGAAHIGVTPSPVIGVTVDTGVLIRTLPETFFGINYVGFWDGHQGSVASARALAQTPIKLIRFPGGDPGDWYDWQDPYYKHWSSTSPLDLWRFAAMLGGTALFQTNYQGHLPNPPRQAYAVNSPQNAAAWVRYDRSHGIRAIMEVGNEEDITMRSAGDPSFRMYVKAFNAQARAMHAVDPYVMVVGPAGTNEWYWWTLHSLATFLLNAGDRYGSGQADGVSLHFYKGTTWQDSMGMAQYWTNSQGPWAYISRTIRLYDKRRLPVFISEWNIGASSVKSTFNRTLGHALVSADMIGAFAESGVAGEVYFDLHGAQGWGLLYGDGESRPVDSPTPTYYAMALWKHMGPRVIGLATTANAATTVSAYATRRDDGSVQLLAINKTVNPQPMRISFKHFNPHGHVLRVYDVRGRTGRVTDVDVLYNGVLSPTPLRSLPGAHVVKLTTSNAIMYTLPPYSAVVLDVGES